MRVVIGEESLCTNGAAAAKCDGQVKIERKMDTNNLELKL